MKAQILKSMIAQGEKLTSGDIVDVSNWRHKKALESNRYIKILDVEPSPIAKAVEEPKAQTPKAKKAKEAE